MYKRNVVHKNMEPKNYILILILILAGCTNGEKGPNVTKNDFTGIWKVDKEISLRRSNKTVPDKYFNLALIIKEDGTFEVVNSLPEFFFDSKQSKHFGTWEIDDHQSDGFTYFTLTFQSLPGVDSGVYGGFFESVKMKTAFRAGRTDEIIYMTKTE